MPQIGVRSSAGGRHPPARREQIGESRLTIRVLWAVVTAAAGLAAASPAAAVRFAVKGDWGWGGRNQAAVTARMCAEHRRAPLAFVLTTGDNFYRPDGEATAANWTRPEACLRRAGLRFRAAWGNHDVNGPGTADVLRAPRWYAFRAGPADVIVLDANQPENPEQLAFLRRRLAASRAPARIVAFHQPVYSAGLHRAGKAQQRLWAPLFRRHRVALVLQGHNHSYERLRVDGVTYVTTGGGGAPVYPCLRRPAELDICRAVFHFLVVTATPRAVAVRAVNVRGGTVDRVRIPLA